MGVRSACIYVPANPAEVQLSMREQLDMLLRIAFSCDKTEHWFTFGQGRYIALYGDESEEDKIVTLRYPSADEVLQYAESEPWTYIDMMLDPYHNLFRKITDIWRSSNDLFGYTPLSVSISIGDVNVYYDHEEDIYDTCLALICGFDGSFDNAHTAMRAIEATPLLAPVIAVFNPEYQDQTWRVLYDVR